MRPSCSRDDGYTLAELMVVVFILSALVAIALTTYAYTTGRTRRLTCETNRRHLDTAVAVYEGANGEPPTVIDDLAPYVTNIDYVKVCPGDRTTELRYDEDLERVVCDFHE